MRCSGALAVIAFLACLTTVTPMFRDAAIEGTQQLSRDAPPEAKAVLKSIKTSGSGCGNNAETFIFKENATMSFDSMVVDNTTKVKKCVIEVDIQLDPKWKYTINTATTIRGYMENTNLASFDAIYTVNDPGGVLVRQGSIHRTCALYLTLVPSRMLISSCGIHMKLLVEQIT
jgi:hypothetical protein